MADRGTFPMSNPQRRVIVIEVGLIDPKNQRRIVVAQDLETGNHSQYFEWSSPPLACPGDVWIAENSMGWWTLTQCLLASNFGGQTTVGEVVARLDAMGFIDWSPWDSPDGTIQTPSGAWIGEQRKFATTACVPRGWLDCDGTDKSRIRYRALFKMIGEDFGPGDGETTFTLPLTVGYWICAE